MWCRCRPATATDLVQTYVSALRRKLPSAGAVIDTRSPGYVLRVDPDRIDHLLFQRLVTEARTERQRGCAQRAAELLDTALGCGAGRRSASWSRRPVKSGGTPGSCAGPVGGADGSSGAGLQVAAGLSADAVANAVPIG